MKKLGIAFFSALGIFTILAVSLTANACAQVSTCQVKGIIVDNQNTPVPFAAVILKAMGKNIARGTSATDSGVFHFDGLQPGKYTATVRRAGFNPQSRDFEILTGQTASMNFTLIPGEPEQSEIVRPNNLTGAELNAQTLRWYSFDEGVALAKKTKKKLLVHVYTDWCKWCKKMDKEVYTNPQVREALQSYFVAVKLNAESSKEVTYLDRRLSEMALAREMGVNGYPTVAFFNSDAELIGKHAGYIESGDLANMLRSIGQDQ